ncbi:ras-associating and dilute domain-containing protein isoform X1 [Ahaetulla prasina]|uniref:ras-associating and dilute domain-containing protein isoform X1 n=2 Tax=Ahaetulla prasina TaxID=499056 RepID=UPI00264831E5|nr:ras-associating and dilute domain-containing protein isoform X1 [Ahaetulla prasina]
MTPSCAMFYRSPSTMSPPSKNRFKRQSRIFSQVLYRTLSYKDRSSVASYSGANKEDPSELSTQVSAPGVLKIFGCHICVGTHYKSVLATASSSAQELLKEALERYGLSRVDVGHYVLCDVVGTFAGSEKQWKMEGLRILRDHEKPLLIQDLWKPREGFSRRFELRKRSEVEEMTAKDKDTITAGINAQARKLQRNRTKGTMTLLMACHTSPPRLRRTVSETSLSQAGPPKDQKEEGPLRRHYSTLPETLRCMEGVPDGRAAAALEEPNVGNTLRLSLYQSPHLLLLQGYSQQHDRLVYLLNREQHTVGQRTQASKPSISLSAPDILPLHCSIRRVKLPTRSHHRCEEKLIIEPIPGANVSINFSEVGKTVMLRHGDLISLGLSYLFLYKDPLKTQLLPTQTLAKLKAMRRASEPEPSSSTCKLCGAHFKDKAASSKKQEVQSSSSRKSGRRKLQLEFDQANEDLLLRRIMTLIEPTGDDHKLAPAFLLCLCIQHSATHFRLGDFGQLLLKATKMVQKSVWEKTNELAEKQSLHQDPASLSLFTISDLLPDLQHVVFWMSNSIEILYFIQQKSPVYIQNMEEELDIKGSKESLFSLTITASEEAMTVLEEVIMYTFQQCVYYISKSLYVALPSLLECNPFQSEGRDGWLSSPPLPEEIHKVVLIYQAALDLLHQYDVHPEVTSQMFAYLFFFSNTLLFNQLMEKGSSLGCFHWSKGVRIRATLRLLMEWAQSVGLGPLADQFFSKLSSMASLLAMPNSQLLQMTWPVLRSEFPALNPAQLNHILTQYQTSSAMGCVPAWQPSNNDALAAVRTDDVLESFDNHPPIMLPTGGFKVDLETDHLDDNVYRHLLYIRHFLWSLRSKSPHSSDSLEAETPKTETINCQVTPPAESEAIIGSVESAFDWTNGRRTMNGEKPKMEENVSKVAGTNLSISDYGTCETQLPNTLQQQQPERPKGKNGTKAVTVSVDSSCLLTPPNTPLIFDSIGLELSPETTPGKDIPESQRNGLNGTKTTTQEGSSPTPYDFPTPASSNRSSATDDFCYVFVVELEKGPIGLGMGLIDGLHTPLSSPGIYIRTLIQDSPAAADGRLSIGDRILAVNGTSLVGSHYQSAVDLIRSGGKKLRFLVAKSDLEVAKKISYSSSPSP